MEYLDPFQQENPASHTLYRKTVKRWTAFHRTKNQLKFLRMCLSEQVIPKTFGMICTTAFNGDAFSEFQRSFLLDRVEHCKSQVEDNHFQLRRLQSSLRENLQSAKFEGAMRRAGEVALRRGAVHLNILLQKLNKLCDESLWTRYCNADNIKNLSSFNINLHQTELLSLGLNFCIGPPKEFLIDSLSSINNFNYYHSNSQIHFLKGHITFNFLNDIHFSVLPNRHQTALKQLRSNNRLKITRADKGGAIVLLDEDDYKLKAHRLLNDTNTYEKLEKVPPVASVQNKFNSDLKKIANNMNSPSEKKLVLSKISERVPSLPYFYGIPKIHKNGCPLRPIVATCNSPHSNLAEWLARELSKYLGMFSPSHLLHSMDFVGRLRSIGRCGGRMMSLDVTALFTNVPLQFVLENLRKKANEGIFNPPIALDSFLDLIKLSVENTVFIFDGMAFKQKFGVAMGSPLSPVLANLCMEFLESEFILNCPDNIKPLVWYRYVDDIFIVYDKDDSSFDNFVSYVNNLLPSIKFTVEREQENKLSFLDVLVHHNPNDLTFSFDIYRKPTNSEMYIHYFSYHHPQVKSNIIVNLVTRALRLCDPCYIDKEFKHIKEVFRKLAYPEFFINKAFSRAKRNYYNPKTNNKEAHFNNALVLPFHHGLVPVKNQLDKHNKKNNAKSNVMLTFNYKNSLSRQIVKNKKVECDKNENGVYSIPCKDCSSRYYGETGRKLSIRLDEHKRDCRQGAQYSAVARHSLDLDHRIDWKNANIIYNNNNAGTRRVVEGALINLMNTFENNKSFTKEDNFTNYLVCSSLKINLNSFSNAPTAPGSSPSPRTGIGWDTPYPSTNTGTEAVQRNHSASPTTGRSLETIIPGQLRRSRRLALRQAITN